MPETTALLLEQIISAPLIAIVHAQKESAVSTLQFLISQMEEREEAGKKKKIPLMLDFSYTQILQDPESGKIEAVPMKMSIPIVTLVPIPYISIDEAELEFKAKIVTSKVREDKGLKSVSLYAIYGAKEDFDLSGELRVKIKAKRTDIPEGLARMVTALSNSIPVVRDEGK